MIRWVRGMTSRAQVLYAMVLTAFVLVPPLSEVGVGHTGDASPAPRPATVTFTNVSESAGLSGLSANFLAWGDYDRDGDEDLLVQGSRLFRNNGPPGWDFTEVTQAAGLSGSFTSGTWGDYNNDGWLDFYAGGTASDKLYRNNGDGTFTDVTVAAGNLRDTFPTTAAGWGDYDRDGDLDLYVANGEDWNGGNPIYFPDIFYKNNGDGTFTNATISANLSEGDHPYYGRGVAWADFNNDGWLDIYVSNYRLSPNYLYVNNHDGTFTEMGRELGCAGVYDPYRYWDAQTQRYWGPNYGHTIGSAWADFDSDGDLDLWTTNLVHKYVGPYGSGQYDIRGYVCDDSKMYKNNGAPFYNFTDIRATCGIPIKPIGGSGVFQGDELFDGVAWGDFDSDGDLDLWIPQVYDLNYAYSYLYEQDGAGNGSCHWTDRAGELGMRVYNTYAGVWCDYDNDGDLDLLTGGKSPYVGENQGTYALHLYRNSGNSNSWLKVRLVGRDCNRAAIGARVTVKSGNLTQIREVEGGMGCHGSQNSLVQHFGLYNRSSIDWVEVRWPCGRIEKFTGVSVNTTLNITESSLPVPRVLSASASPPSPLEDQPVSFSASANVEGGSIAKYEWDFTSDNTYDWASEVGGSASHSYSKSGIYHARLRAWSDRGIGVEYGPVVVTVLNAPPVAEAGPDISAAMDELVRFDGSGSTDTQGDMSRGLQYNWSFGDGSHSGWSASPLANHTYTAPGEYTVRLSVRDDDGAVASDTLVVRVRNVPPTVTVMEPVSALEDEEVQFTGRGSDTPSDAATLVYKWDFGDGNSTAWSTNPSARHAYTAKGIYTARLFVRDQRSMMAEGAVNVTVINPPPVCHINPECQELSASEDHLLTFEGWGADTPSDLPYLMYMWDFGDGNRTEWSELCAASHAYAVEGTYTLTLFARDDDGDTGSEQTVVRVENSPPTAEILSEGGEAAEDQTILFTGEGRDTPSDLPLLEYRWDFGDGSRSDWSPVPEASHAYPSAGTYEVTLSVRDDQGARFTTRPLVIEVRNLPPVAVASSALRNVDEDTEVWFSAANSTDTPSDMSSLTYRWFFGDGSEEEGIEVSHVFVKSGTYTVRLVVTDNDGATGEDSSIKIRVRNLQPTASASADRMEARVGERVSFRGSGNDTPTDALKLRFRWYFGDGSQWEGRDAEHVYNGEGSFRVRLEVSDPEGDVGVAELTINVTAVRVPSPQPAHKLDPAVLWGAAALVVLVAAIAALIWRRSSRAPPEAEPAGPEEEGPMESQIGGDGGDRGEDGKSEDRNGRFNGGTAEGRGARAPPGG
ncbi:MAG: PKD domain-containing protein [Thermoplasmata archaeon]